MAKKKFEINKFTGGIVSTPSSTDADANSAKYSLNVDPNTAEGRLQGIDMDKIMSTLGFGQDMRDSDVTWWSQVGDVFSYKWTLASGKDAVVINTEGKNVCAKCYRIYIKKEKYYGRQSST